MGLFTIACVLAFQIPLIFSFSACDPIDVVFVIDTEFIKHEKSGIIDFILNIANNDNEDNGYSVILYGNNIPLSMDPILINIQDTQHVHNKQKQTKLISATLNEQFDYITEFDLSNSNNTKIVEIDEIIDNILKHPKSVHIDKKKYILGDFAGRHDDDQSVFIFSYRNTIDFSSIYAQFEIFSDKFVHFILNGVNDETEDTNTLPYTYLDYNSVIKDKIELIYSLTCPTLLLADDNDYFIELNNHIQFVENDTIISCNIAHKNKTNPNLNGSYIYVYNDIDDDNTMTFHETNYLISDQNTLKQLPLSCNSNHSISVFKIIKIIQLDNYNINELRSLGYNMNQINKINNKLAYALKIYIQTPMSPLEYINSIKLKYTEPLQNRPKKQPKYPNKRNLNNIMQDGFDNSILPYSSSHYSGGATTAMKLGGGKKIWNDFVITGYGNIDISYKYEFDLNVNLLAYFKWDLGMIPSYFPGYDVTIEYKLYGDYHWLLEYSVAFDGQIHINTPELLNMKLPLTILIFGIPIPYQLFFDLTIGIVFTTPSISIKTGIKCEEKETFEIGYHFTYDAGDIKQDDIDRTTPITSYCEPLIDKPADIGVEFLKQICNDELKFFEITLTPRIGIQFFYEIFKIYLKPEVTIPVIFKNGITDTTSCWESKCSDVTENALNFGRYNLQFPLNFQLYIAFQIDIDIDRLLGQVFNAANGIDFDATGTIFDFNVETTVGPMRELYNDPLNCVAYLPVIGLYMADECCGLCPKGTQLGTLFENNDITGSGLKGLYKTKTIEECANDCGVTGDDIFERACVAYNYAVEYGVCQIFAADTPNTDSNPNYEHGTIFCSIGTSDALKEDDSIFLSDKNLAYLLILFEVLLLSIALCVCMYVWRTKRKIIL